MILISRKLIWLFRGEPSVDCQCSGSRLSKKSFLLFGGQVHTQKKHYVCFFNWIVLKTEEKWTVGTRMSLKKIAYAEK